MAKPIKNKKTCSGCGTDVTFQKRVNMAGGGFWCLACNQAQVEAARSGDSEDDWQLPAAVDRPVLSAAEPSRVRSGQWRKSTRRGQCRALAARSDDVDDVLLNGASGSSGTSQGFVRHQVRVGSE